jgi:hypothetical protein
VGNIFGDITRPALGGIKANDPHGFVVLAIQHVGDNRFQIGHLDVGLPLNAAEITEIIGY